MPRLCFRLVSRSAGNCMPCIHAEMENNCASVCYKSVVVCFKFLSGLQFE